MKKIFSCRRSSLALVGMILLFSLAYVQGAEATKAVAMPIFLLAGGVAAANAYEKTRTPKEETK